MGDWSNLPKDLLVDISKRLTINADFVRFRALCNSWRSAVSERLHHLPCQLPWLMLPYKDGSSTLRGFFSLSNSNVYWLELPKAFGKRFCGSSHGWLVFVEEQSPAISLLNPLTQVQLQLPPVTAIPDVLDFRMSRVGEEYVIRDCSGTTSILSLKDVARFYMSKIILSENPTANNYTAMAIFGDVDKLAFCRSTDEKWTIIEEAGKPCAYDDIVYCKEQFYAVNCRGRVVVCDVKDSSQKLVTITPPVDLCCISDRKYLVECCGELLLVFRHTQGSVVKYEDGVEGYFHTTLFFKVFKLNHQDNQTWVEMKSLGDSMLFLGDNCSLSLSAKDFPECKANCIYFTDDYSEGDRDGKPAGHDVGIFNLEDQSIQPFLGYMDKYKLINVQRTIWVTPSLY